MNALSKSIETTTISINITANTEIAEKNAEENPKGRQSLTTPYLFKIISATIIIEDSTRTVKFILKRTLQSAKCDAPLIECLNTPVEKVVLGKVK